MANTRRRSVSLVQMVRISSPCPLAGGDWGRTERVRFCPQCNLNVHNISAMDGLEAESLLWSAQGRVCLRYEQDRDQRPITSDRSLRLVWNRIGRKMAAI